MKDKLLFLAIVLTVALGFNSSAQLPTSVNVVGYANITVPANGYIMLGVPLEATNNSLNTILALPDGYDGASIYRFDPATQGYRNTVQWVGGAGWLSVFPEDIIINPGEGFFLQNVAGTPLSISFVGE